MGQATSNITKVVTRPLSWWKGDNGNGQESGNQLAIPKGATLFVYKRQGSMFFDEDGDLAHEFWCEVVDRKTKKVVMRRRLKNLIPQGEIELPQPSIHGDLPVIMYDVTNHPSFSQSQSSTSVHSS